MAILPHVIIWSNQIVERVLVPALSMHVSLMATGMLAAVWYRWLHSAGGSATQHDLSGVFTTKACESRVAWETVSMGSHGSITVPYDDRLDYIN